MQENLFVHLASTVPVYFVIPRRRQLDIVFALCVYPYVRPSDVYPSEVVSLEGVVDLKPNLTHKRSSIWSFGFERFRYIDGRNTQLLPFDLPNYCWFIRPEPYLLERLEFLNQTTHTFKGACENVTLQVLDILMEKRQRYGLQITVHLSVCSHTS